MKTFTDDEFDRIVAHEVRLTTDAMKAAAWEEKVKAQAALDEVLKEAETFAIKLLTMYRFAGLDEERSELMQEVKAFLNRPDVQAWRARQKEQG